MGFPSESILPQQGHAVDAALSFAGDFFRQHQDPRPAKGTTMCTPLLPAGHSIRYWTCKLAPAPGEFPHAGLTQENQSAAIRDYNVAAALQNAGLYPRAAERWTNFIKTHPKDTRLDRATYYLGVCQLHTKAVPPEHCNLPGIDREVPQVS